MIRYISTAWVVSSDLNFLRRLLFVLNPRTYITGAWRGSTTCASVIYDYSRVSIDLED